MTCLQLPQCFVCGCLFVPTFSGTTNDFFFQRWITSLFHIWSQKVNVIDLVALILCFVLCAFTWIRGIVVDGKEYVFFFFNLFSTLCLCPVLAGAFEDEDIIHVEGTVDPVRDMEIIHEELRMKDEEMIGPIIDKLEKTAIRGGDKKLKPEYVSQCPSRPFAPPHSKAQIITLPHTWPWRKKYIFLSPSNRSHPSPWPIFSLSQIESDQGSEVFCCRNH